MSALLLGVGVATALVATKLMDANVDRALAAAAAAATTAGNEVDESEHPPGPADTFVLFLNPQGRVIANP